MGSIKCNLKPAIDMYRLTPKRYIEAKKYWEKTKNSLKRGLNTWIEIAKENGEIKTIEHEIIARNSRKKFITPKALEKIRKKIIEKDPEELIKQFKKMGEYFVMPDDIEDFKKRIAKRKKELMREQAPTFLSNLPEHNKNLKKRNKTKKKEEKIFLYSLCK